MQVVRSVMFSPNHFVEGGTQEEIGCGLVVGSRFALKNLLREALLGQ